MTEKLNPFYKLLKTEITINIKSELKETFDSVNKALNDACQVALKQHLSGKTTCLNDGCHLQKCWICPHD